MKYRELLSGVATSPPIVVNGTEYTGSYLAMQVAIRDSIGEEARRTVPLIAELGRLSAAAHNHFKLCEARYRAWRDGTIYRLTNYVSEAAAAGFECAANPGKDAKGKDKPAKTPATTAVEAYMRTLPEYLTHQQLMADAEEAWATIHTTLEAAKQRTWALKAAQSYEHGEAQGDNSKMMKSVADTPESEDIPSSRPKRRGPPPPPKRKGE